MLCWWRKFLRIERDGHQHSCNRKKELQPGQQKKSSPNQCLSLHQPRLNEMIVATTGLHNSFSNFSQKHFISLHFDSFHSNLSPLPSRGWDDGNPFGGVTGQTYLAFFRDWPTNWSVFMHVSLFISLTHIHTHVIYIHTWRGPSKSLDSWKQEEARFWRRRSDRQGQRKERHQQRMP